MPTIPTETLASSLEAWAADLLSINTVEHAPTSLSDALPLVVSEITNDSRASSQANLPAVGTYQQTHVRARIVRLLLMVTPEPSWDATKLLYGYVDTIGAEILRDPKLGGRVETTSPFYEASYDPPEVQYEDGTVARAATVTLTIGETTGV